ncbi:hypothetical protein ABGT22_19835 [Peribacillus frigoritolerans]|uniref:hypothetical protein n=1 Tax=Peribacillus frigoritolerans TaxID=450367 RepID=UPI00345D8885
MIRNIFSLLLILAMLVSCVVPPSIQQPSTVHAATNQEQVNGIKYTNEELGFELTLPESWRDKYNIEVTDNGNVAFKAKLNETYDNEIYDNIFLFTIHVYDENPEIEGGEGGLLGTNNGKAYYETVDYALFHYDRYDEMFPDATEDDRRLIATMTKQIKDIDFKMLGLKGSVAEEAKPNEEEGKGDTAEEAVGDRKFWQWNRDLSERLSKTTVNKHKLLHAFRKYPDPAKATEDFMNNWKIKGMAPGTVLITPDSVAYDFRYGHAAIVASDGWHVIEAAGPGEIVRKIHINEFINIHPYWVAYSVDGATEEQAMSASVYAEEQERLKKPYITKGFIEAAGDVFWRGGFLTGKYREDAFYCSSIVWRAWKNQGFDIDYNDDKPTPVHEDGSIVDALTDFNFGFIPDEKVVTVLPAEIVKDPLMVTVAVSEELRGQDMEPKTAEFTNKLTKFALSKGAVIPYTMDIWQSKGHRYKLDVTKNEAVTPTEISLFNSSNKEVYNYVLQPGETLKDIYVETPEGYHTLEIRTKRVKRTNTVISNTGDVEGTFISVFELVDN